LLRALGIGDRRGFIGVVDLFRLRDLCALCVRFAVPPQLDPASKLKCRCYNSAWLIAMTTPSCQHKRTQLIAKDKDAQYTECLDCGEILEAGEMENKEGAGFDESLSDA
jgi:hypothetical protein